MGRLYVYMNDHHSFMHEVSELLEHILDRPVSEIEDWRRIIDDARTIVTELQSKAEPCSPDDYPHEFPFV